MVSFIFLNPNVAPDKLAQERRKIMLKVKILKCVYFE